MPKTIHSPVEEFPGDVILYDPLTFPMVIEFRKAVDKGLEIVKNDEGEKDYYQQEIEHEWLKGVCACVDEWELEGYGQLTPDNFPASPVVPVSRLVSWLVGEITAIYKGDQSEKNE